MKRKSSTVLIDKNNYSSSDYHTNVDSVKHITKHFPGLKDFQIRKLLELTARKVKYFTKNKYFERMSDKEITFLVHAIEVAREETAKKYAKKLKNSSNDIHQFLNILVKTNLLSEYDSKYVTQKEIDGLSMISSYPQDIIESILLEDIDDFNNLFKTFQNAVASHFFPPKRVNNKTGIKNNKTKLQSIVEETQQVNNTKKKPWKLFQEENFFHKKKEDKKQLLPPLPESVFSKLSVPSYRQVVSSSKN